MASRDARFDGHFFVAVRSTGIYCRPVCPAPNPKPRNCLFVPSAAAAERAGFRPCLRCRPESAPGTPAWSGTAATVSRALRLIAEGALDGGGVDALAARLGVGARHLRRLFVRRLGAPPLAIARTQRVQLAKRLLDDTDFAIGEVALASGFASLRRFNDAVVKAYGVPPRALRRRRSPGVALPSGAGFTLRLAYRPPYQWDAMMDFLAPRATPGVEVVSRTAYRRSLAVGDAVGFVEVRPAAGNDHLVAHLRLSRAVALTPIVARLRRLFDLGADPGAVDGRLREDPLLARRVRDRPGLRVPGAWDGYELAVRAILGQQVSVKGATTLAGRLVERFGVAPDAIGGVAPDAIGGVAPDAIGGVAPDAIGGVAPDAMGGAAPGAIGGVAPGAIGGVAPDAIGGAAPDAVEGDGAWRQFPPPERLADADVAAIGLPRARARAVSALARAVASGELALDGARGLDETVERLCALPGIGPWTAHYIAMRAFGDPDAFPAGDLGLQRAAANGGGRLTPAALSRRAEAWRPWRAYAAMHLWTALAEAGGQR